VTTTSGITLDDSGENLIIRFKYDPVIVGSVKDIPGRKWNSEDLCWTAPVDVIRLVRQFGERHNIKQSDDVSLIPDVEPEIRPTAIIVGGLFLIQFHYDRDLIARVKDIPGIKWNPKRKAWTTGLDAAIEVADFVVSTNARIDSDTSSALEPARGSIRRIAESAASTAEIQIPGLNGELLPFQKAGVVYAMKAMGKPIPEGV